MSGDTTVRPTSCTTADGLHLEAEAAIPADATRGAVLTHPHPLHGGSMQSLVTGELFRALPAAGIGALRFNFRGVGNSEGEHGGGVDEAGDVVAAIDALATALPGVPLAICGWSFGADVALRVVDDRLGGWFCVAPPLRIVDPAEMRAATDQRPKVLVVPEHDQFRQPGSAREVTASWTNTEVVPIAGADHFLVGRTDQVTTRAASFLESL